MEHYIIKDEKVEKIIPVMVPPKRASEMLGIPLSRIRYLYRYEEDFPAVKIRDRYYINLQKAEEWLMREKTI